MSGAFLAHKTGGSDTTVALRLRAAPHAVLRLVSQVLLVGPLAAALVLSAVFLTSTLIGAWRGISPPSTDIFRLLPGGAYFVVLEDILPLLLLLWAAMGCSASWLARATGDWAARRWWRSELILARRLNRLGLPLAIVAGWFSLATVWSQISRPTHADNHTPYSAMLGHVPWSDALAYYCGAEEIADSGHIDIWNQRRPVNAALFAARLAAAGFNSQRAIWLQVVLLATAIYLVAHAAGTRYGVWAAIATSAMLFGYARLFLATVLSESLGITFGAVGAALLLQSIHRRSILLAGAGMFSLAMALSVRAGAMFLLPALLLWAWWQFGPGWRRRARAALTCAAAILLAVSVNLVVLKLYGTGQNIWGSNFAPTLCGMTEGAGWAHAYAKYEAEVLQRPLESDQAAFFYAKAWENLRADPSPLISTVVSGSVQFVRSTPKYLPSLTAVNYPPTQRWARRMNRADAIAYYLLYLGVLITFWRCRREGDYRLALAVGCGALASVPFVFLDGGWRVFAASWPLHTALLAGGFASGRRRAVAGAFVPHSAAAVKPEQKWYGARLRKKWHVAPRPVRLALGLAVALPLLAIVGPWLVYHCARRPAPDALAAIERSDQVIIRRLSELPAVVVVADGQAPPPGMPSVSLSDFRKLVDRQIHEEIRAIDPLPPTPFVITAAHDFVTSYRHIAFGPLEAFQSDEPFHTLTVDQLRGRYYALILGPTTLNHHAQTDVR